MDAIHKVSGVWLVAAPHLVDVEPVPAALHEAGLGHQLGGAAPLEAVLPLGEEEGAVIRGELRVHKQLPGLRTPGHYKLTSDA